MKFNLCTTAVVHAHIHLWYFGVISLQHFPLNHSFRTILIGVLFVQLSLIQKAENMDEDGGTFDQLPFPTISFFSNSISRNKNFSLAWQYSLLLSDFLTSMCIYKEGILKSNFCIICLPTKTSSDYSLSFVGRCIRCSLLTFRKGLLIVVNVPSAN